MTRVHSRDLAFDLMLPEGADFPILSCYAFVEQDASTAALTRWLADRAAGVPEFHEKLVIPAWGIGDGYWAHVSDMDAEAHVHVEAATDWHRFTGALRTIQSMPFDHSRPMWRLHVFRSVSGLPACTEPVTVIVVVMHHAAVDGRRHAEISRLLFSPEVAAPPAGRRRSRTALTLLSILQVPCRPLLIAADIRRLSRAQAAARTPSTAAVGPLRPPTAVNRPVGERRTFDALAVSRSALAAAVGDTATPNDVILAVIGGALNRHLGRPPGGLCASVPASTVRLSDHTRNHVAALTIDLHTDEHDVRRRAAKIHTDVQERRSAALAPSQLALSEVSVRFPVAMHRRSAASMRRAVDRRSEVATHTTISSVHKGTGDGWCLMDSRVVANFGLPVLHGRNGLMHTASSIGDIAVITAACDPDQLTDLRRYLNELRAGFAAVGALLE